MSRNFWPKPGSVMRVVFDFCGVRYDHYGVYVGEENVIHFSEKKVRQQNLREFIRGAAGGEKSLQVISFPETFTKKISLEQCCERAYSYIGYDEYNFFLNNCEHFATWCRTGIAESSQAFKYRSSKFGATTSMASAGELTLIRNYGDHISNLGISVDYEMSFLDIENGLLCDPPNEDLGWVIGEIDNEVVEYRAPYIRGGIYEMTFIQGPQVGRRVEVGRLVGAALFDEISPMEFKSPVNGVIEFSADDCEIYRSGDILLKIRMI